MRKLNTLLIPIIFILTISCKRNEGKFTISNESDFNIDSLSIIPDSKMKVLSLKKGEKIHHKTLMNEIKSDGGYLITFKNSETQDKVSRAFGYFTNGYQIEDVINIRVLNDTILIDGKFEKPY